MSNLTDIIGNFTDNFMNNPTRAFVIPYNEILGSTFIASLVIIFALLIYSTTKRWEILVPYFLFVNLFLTAIIPVQYMLVIALFTVILSGGLIYKVFLQKEGARL